MMEAVQPQVPPTTVPGEPQEFRTPEEIMVTLLAQTIIVMLSQQTSGKERAATETDQPEETLKEGEKAQEKPKEKSASKTKEKSTESKSEKLTTKTAERSGSQPQTSGKTVRPHEMMARMLQRNGSSSKPAPAAKEAPSARAHALPTARSAETAVAPKPLMPAPPHVGRFRGEGNRVLEEQGTSRRAMPQGPRHAESRSDQIFERKVDKDREEQPRKRQKFEGKKVGKAGGTEKKVDHVAQQLFTPPPKNDFEAFLRTMMQDSELSEFFGVRISHFDVMLLFIELMKLEVEDNHNERVARLDERKYQIEWMENVVQQYKAQAKFLRIAGIGAGALGVFAGALPIIGHVGGDFILDKLKMVTSSFEGMKRMKVFGQFSEMFKQFAEVNKGMGHVQSSFCDGERSWAEHKSSLHKTDGEESTRAIEERTREFKNWNDVLAQFLRMEQDLVRQLYNG